VSKRRRSKAKVSKKDIQKLYLDEGLSLREVAERLGTTQTTIMNRVREFGFELRDKSESRTLAVKKSRTHKRIHNFDERFFDEIGPLQAYAMGLIWGGGYNTVGSRINLMCGDENIDICSKLKELLKMQSFPDCIEQDGTSTMWASVVNSVELSRRMLELGLPMGSHANLMLPELHGETCVDFARGWWEKRGFTSLSPHILEELNERALPGVEMHYRNERNFVSYFKSADDIKGAYDVLYSRTHPKFYISRRRAAFIEGETARTADRDFRELYNSLPDISNPPDRSAPEIHTWTGSILVGKI